MMTKGATGAGRLALCLWLAGAGAAQAGMQYNPVLPQFGGLNGQALQILQFEKGLADARKAREDAARRSAAATVARTEKSAADRLLDTITNTLRYQISQNITDEILDGAQLANTFNLGDGLSIAYVRDAGRVELVITDAIAGETTEITIPLSGQD